MNVRSVAHTAVWLGFLVSALACPAPTYPPMDDDDDSGLPGDDDDSAGDDDDSAGDDDDSAGDDDDDSTAPATCLTTPNGEPLLPDSCVELAACSIQGSEAVGYHGSALASGGDFDGDGRVDLAIGAPRAERDASPEGTRDEGLVEIFTAASLGDEEQPPAVRIWGDRTGRQAGYSLAFVGDVNGDEYDDLLIGAQGEDGPADRCGAAMLVFGRDLSEVPPGTVIEPDVVIFGTMPLDRVGRAVAAIGDVTGDGLAEFALSSGLSQDVGGNEYAAAGSVHVFHGRRTWPPQLLVTQGESTWEGAPTQIGFGRRMSGGEDATGDGLADLLVGAPDTNSWRGQVWLMSGAALGGGSGTAEATTAGVLVAEGVGVSDNLGWDLEMASDLTGDGLADIVVGAPLADGNLNGAGEVRVYAGSKDLMETGTSDLRATIYGSWDDDQFGTSLAVGDTNGDGVGDLMVGAIQTLRGLLTKSGRVYLFHGREDWTPIFEAEQADAWWSGAGANEYLGTRVAAGDLDGDGDEDLIMSAPYRSIYGTYSGETYIYWGE